MRSAIAMVVAAASISVGVYLIAGLGVALVVAGVLLGLLAVLLGEASS